MVISKPQADGTVRLERLPQAVRPIVDERQPYGAEQLDRPIATDDGSYTPPHIAIDILGSLLRRNTITGDEWLAGYRFRAWFRMAQLEQLRAADMGRLFVDGGGRAPEMSANAVRGRREIDKAIRYVGGRASSSGSCLWHVIGLEHSLRRWVQEQAKASQARRLHQAGATGVLIVALETLARMPWVGPYEKTS